MGTTNFDMKNSFKSLLLSVLVFAGSATMAQSNDPLRFIEEGAKEIFNGLNEEGVEETHHESAEEVEEEHGFDPVHHVMDAHDIHLWGEGHESVSVPLPIILWTENGLVTFMSSEFHHDDKGEHKVEKNGMTFVKLHEKIYQLNSGAEELVLNHETHEAENAVKPLDFSITKVVFASMFVAVLMLLIFLSMAKRYKGDAPAAPKGVGKFMEPLVYFVKDFAEENIGHKYMKFMPYLLTVFFFIWFGNLFGLVPFFGGVNMTGSISITLTLALFTLVIQMIYSKWPFWKHMVNAPRSAVANLVCFSAN